MDRTAVLKWVKRIYGTDPDYPWQDQNAVLRHKDNRKWYALLMEVRREKLGLAPLTQKEPTSSEMVGVLNVKSDPNLIITLTEHTVLAKDASKEEKSSPIEKKGFLPAYHMNKENWISILLDGSVPEKEIKSLIELSYQMTETKKEKSK